jgi:hypothetical protein
MRGRGLGRAINRLLEDLSAGDPVAWGFVAVIAVLALGFGLLWLKVRRDLQREDEARARKYGRGQNQGRRQDRRIS